MMRRGKMSLINLRSILKIAVILSVMMLLCFTVINHWLVAMSRPVDATVYLWIFFSALFVFYTLLLKSLIKLKWWVNYPLSFMVGIAASFLALFLSSLFVYEDSLTRLYNSVSSLYDLYIMFLIYMFRAFLLGGWLVSMLTFFFYKRWDVKSR